MSLTPFQTRYGVPVTEPTIQPSKVIETQLNRRSIRFFNNKPLPDGMLELLMASAQSSPSSGMLQTWSVLVLSSTEDKLKLLSDPYMSKIVGNIDSHNYNAINTCSVFLIWLADLARLDAILKDADCGQDIKDQTSLAEYHLKAVIDATIAAQTFYMSAESMGLYGTYMGAIRQLPIEMLAKHFNLPNHVFPLFGMAVGYSAGTEQIKIKQRLPVDIVMHKSVYKELDKTKLEQYDQSHKSLIHNGESLTFSERVVERLSPSLSKSWIGDNLRKMGFTFK